MILHDLRLRALTPIAAYQQKRFVRHNAVTAFAIRDLDLVAQVYIVIVEQPGSLPAWERIFQVHKETVEQMQVIHLQMGNSQRVDLCDQRLFELKERLHAATVDILSGNAPAAEGLSPSRYTAAARGPFAAVIAAVHTANCPHGLPPVYSSKYT